MEHVLAYMISAYTEPESLVALVNALDSDKVDFYIHIDKKVEIAPFYKFLKNRTNVFFTKYREKVNWGVVTDWNAICFNQRGIGVSV